MQLVKVIKIKELVIYLSAKTSSFMYISSGQTFELVGVKKIPWSMVRSIASTVHKLHRFSRVG